MDKENNNKFISFVLLENNHVDCREIKKQLETTWGITTTVEAEKDSYIFEWDGMMASIALIDARIPNHEAEENAKKNYFWKEAETQAAKHQAHFLVFVFGNKQTAIEAGLLLVKLCDACTKITACLGIFTSGTVFQPEMYNAIAQTIKEGMLPIYIWVYFGLYPDEKNRGCGYTFGLKQFGKKEVEIIGSYHSPQEVRDCLFNVAYYVIENNITLNNGETIGFNPKEKLRISLSAGIMHEDRTLKIDY